ncbi:hypothetical protein BDQ12DRAFT_672009 [Crucibulum laeve]|uniref:Uncharacterized protein n=1 Tax=Crucibulum laeve TaxID=68775 RepID=A0A5C3LER9_9AGAR|nr:hypothetical protein BDQ12DRAFT_672009 [Crucibulum laeve]
MAYVDDLVRRVGGSVVYVDDMVRQVDIVSSSAPGGLAMLALTLLLLVVLAYSHTLRVPPYMGLPVSLASHADLLIIASGLGLVVDVIESSNDRWAVVVEKKNGGGSREEEQQQQWQ